MFSILILLKDKFKMELSRKGIIIAGGNGTRLAPLTNTVSKQLMPIYDKPMIYYPLSTLMLFGIKEIMIITTSKDSHSFKNLLNDGSQLGLNIEYEVQEKPNGIAEAFLIARNFIGNSPVVLALGDNIFYGSNLVKSLKEANADKDFSTIFAYRVKDPERYGVVDFDKSYKILSIEEKPKNPKTFYAVTGLYFFNNTILDKALRCKPSKRGELEISSINQEFLKEKKLKLKILGRGTAWLDTGTFDSLHEAGSFIRTIEQRQGFKVGCPEEIAWRKGWITNKKLENLSKQLMKSGYGEYLINLLKDKSKISSL